MSDTLRISYVVEGPTDYIVLDALVEKFLNGQDYVPTQIQPQNSDVANHQGPLGGGWRGVLRWCEELGATPDGFATSLPILNLDYLIIHIDADIASETELQSLALAEPCPPATLTCDNIRQHLTNLLGGSLPHGVLLCVPAQSTEAWVFAALHTNEIAKFAPIECREEVARLLIGKPDRLVRDKDGAARKQPDKYLNTAQRIAKNWVHATSVCTEALRFETEFKNLQ